MLTYMNNNKINIKELINEGEGYLVEFKEAPKNLEKDICAFANASGGKIYIGISDDGKIKPIKLTNKLKSQLVDFAHNLEPMPEMKIESLGSIVCVSIRESHNKPVRSSNGFYLRSGATSQKLSRDEILAFAITETKILFDSQLYTDETVDQCLDIRAVEFFRRRAKLDIALDNRSVLMNLSCIKLQNNKAYLTMAGFLLFANKPTRVLPHVTITVINLDDPATIREQKIFKGTLFEQVEKAFHFVKDCLHTRPKIKSLIREDVLEIPEFVIRELLVNSVVHRDYFERSADVVIKIYPEYIEFSNPGKISDKLSLNSLFGRSFRRNPMIADLFFHANYIERAGTGLLRVQKALKDNNLSPIQLSEEGPFFVVKLQRPGNVDFQADLNERQLSLLKLSDDFPPFSAKQYASRFNVSERTARIDIQYLIKLGLIVKIKCKRNVLYELSK